MSDSAYNLTESALILRNPFIANTVNRADTCYSD